MPSKHLPQFTVPSQDLDVAREISTGRRHDRQTIRVDLAQNASPCPQVVPQLITQQLNYGIQSGCDNPIFEKTPLHPVAGN